MILSFKKQFEPLILSGSKIHTIRADPHDRWKPGRKTHMATGVRTKKYNCFQESVCVSVQDFMMLWFTDADDKSLDYVNVFIDKKCIFEGVRYLLSDIKEESKGHTIEALAKNDGFNSVGDFFKWFNADFEGKIIHWTNHRY